MKIFETVAALKLATLTAEQLVETKGYYAVADGGQARYLIKTASDFGAVPDSYGDHTLANGNIAELQDILINNKVSVEQYGAVGDGATDDYQAIAAVITKVNSLGGGEIYFKPGVTYLVTNDPGTSGSSAYIHFYGQGATLKRDATTAQYNMFTPGSNWVLEELHLEGYIDSGTDWSNVVPSFSFGYRLDAGQKDVTFIRCQVDNIPYDGWYISNGTDNIKLDNCQGGQTSECYRNTIAVAPSGAGQVTGYVEINGGKYAKAKTRPAIDIEPDGGGSVTEVKLTGGVRCTGAIDILSQSKHVIIDNVILDGTDAWLFGFLFDVVHIVNLNLINGAYIKSLGGFDQGSTGSEASSVDNGTVIIENIKDDTNDYAPEENLISGSYNTRDNWSSFVSGTGTATIEPNKKMRDNRGIFLSTTDLVVNYSQTIDNIAANTYYSFGSAHDPLSGSFATIILRELDAGGNPLTYRTFRGGRNSFSNIVFRTNPNTARITVIWGIHSASGNHSALFGPLYLRKGLVSDWGPHILEKDGPIYSAAPTDGTWEQGQRVFVPAPTAGGFIGFICVSSGTPGTWRTFGPITV